ncbi:MAG TPA: DUF1800 domain-containing protein [Acidobacteriaceae bacterium]|nr:DUF1800 domain-containing protein [Acidobacteriaceae bacterium]
MARRRLDPKPLLSLRSAACGALTGFLCASLLMPLDLLAEPQPPTTARAARKGADQPQLRPEQKALHALNRLTFGPRPGDIAAVDRIGLDEWFQRQLHPDTLDDSALEARLARFPAMKLTQAELVERFPTPEMLRRYTRGGLVIPDDDTERVIYADAALSYEEKKEAAQAARTGQAASGTHTATAPSGESPMPSTGGRNDLVSSSGSAMQGKPGAPIIRIPADPAPDAAANAPADTMRPALKDAVLDLNPALRMQRLLSMTPEQMASFQAAMKGPDQERLYAGLSPAQVEQVAAMKAPERVIGAEALSVRLLRDVYSERQVQAVMTDFWLNHFSVYLRKNQNEPYLLPAYERDAVLPNALGKFEDLLVATAKSPAMLVYLDNWESIGPNSRAAGRAQAIQANRPGTPLAKFAAKMPKGINENYARELMELHTLGVKGGYTQADVIEVAKCFTGWTIDRPAQGGEFLFNPNRHEPGDKTVLGHVIHEGGMDEGLQVLHLLATSPATAHFVSLKLAQRFVSDTPPPALVDRMAATFLKSSGDIKAVLTTMFRSPEFWSPEVYRVKVKTPVEFVASALRATNADVSNPLPLVQALDRLGMPVYGMQTPNGYSWQADAWVSSNALLTRMNFALVLSGNRLQGTRVNWPALLGSGIDPNALPNTATEGRLETALLGQPAAAQTRDAALSEASSPGVQQMAEQSFRATPASSVKQPMQADGGPGMLRVKAGRGPAVAPGPETPLATTAGLLLGSPDFQRR